LLSLQSATMRRSGFLSRFSILPALILCAFGLPLIAQDFNGKVVGISDGDTIKVMHNGVAEKIRLNGIDCPEKDQPFGTKAKQFASDMVFGQVVKVVGHGKDKYGRTIGEVILEDGRNLNKELIKAGMAWWYKKYSKDKELKALANAAKKAKMGLWADPHPIPPWKWRHGGKPPGSDK
jgi:micrococcal nuclease